MQTDFTLQELESICAGPPSSIGRYGHIFKMFTFPSVLAIKQVKLHGSIGKDEKTIREQQILHQISKDPERSPFIVDVQGCYLGLEHAYIVFNWEECTLSKFDRYQTYAFRTYRRVLYQIASAIAYLHKHEIIHRDIKPSNILLTSPNLALAQVKLADFGFAKVQDPDRLVQTIHIGTPAYAAPEILQGESIYTEKVDVWSFGVVAYELLTNRKPFQSGTLEELKAAQSSLLDFSKLSPEAQIQNSAEFLSSCLKRDATERISISEVLAHPFFQISA